MFHFPDSERRGELMIIYGEALPPSIAAPERAARFQLDDVFTNDLVHRMQEGLTIRKR
jgi:hypothetical protein